MYSKIVVGTDGSDSASEAVSAAAALARQAGGVVHLVIAYNQPGGALAVPAAGVAAVDTGIGGALLAQRGQDILDSAVLLLEGVTVERHVTKGDAADVLVAVATEVAADLIVVGSKGMNRRIFGSVPNSVAHGAPCSVLIVKTA